MSHEIIMEWHDKIQFNAENHTYMVDGVAMPSVSDIIRPVTNMTYGSIPKFILAQAQDKGTTIHTMMQAYDELGLLPNTDNEYYDYMKAYVDFQRDNFIDALEYVGSELRVYDDTIGYCGTVDKLYWDNESGEYVILDIKTGSKSNPKSWMLQMDAYIMAIERETRECCNAKVLWLKNDGTYELFLHEVSNSAIIESLKDLYDWMKEE